MALAPPTGIDVEALYEFARTLDSPTVLLPIEDYEEMATLIEREYPGVRYGWSELVPEGRALIVSPRRLDSPDVISLAASSPLGGECDRRFIQCFPSPPVPPRRTSDIFLASVA